ncbi:hypothetical protein M422DRAFT_35645 [Sphaerobolus stellatus SS14]|uniref:Uncharacterized protein n=1 Tax=Sphaerobolus stellatus (strain SS14) TaxID=990650 RepID=A0A0C9TS37_SPHS4|nr:hypothetical protein M422DRAFT_35645 [Sphaerobolus stellatus SS14]
MATLDTHPQLPPQLLPEPLPTVNNLIGQIEPWVIYHLLKTVESNVHYENHLYGPITSFLTSIFPTRRRYMLIPQAILRRAMNDDEVRRHGPNVSIGSTGAFHESRHLGGPEALKQFPDFVIVKVTPQDGIERKHYIVCIIEVKRNDDTDALAVDQMTRYMEQAANLPLRVEGLCGYLIMGSGIRKFQLENFGAGVKVTWEPLVFKMTDAGDRFTRELCEISISNWNYQS